jgi:type IV pilus assembly protein PilE
MATKSSGFTLIELLVVVAILGIIAAIGIVSYNGYVASAKRKSAENVIQQIALGQTEYYSDNGSYYHNISSTTCSPTTTTSTDIETNLLGGADNITPQMGYEFCVANPASSNYEITAVEDKLNGPCILRMDHLNRWCHPTGKCTC